MQRRNVLSTAATLLAGAGFASIANEASARPSTRHAATDRISFPYLETDSDMWQYQMLHLASSGVRSIAYDQRGCGRSSDPGTGYDFDTLADDLASVIEQLQLRKVILVGHSIGTGQIVRYLTRHGTQRVSGIVLLSASLPYIQKSAANPDGVDPVCPRPR